MNPIFSSMNESNTVCIFHAADLDGWMSCAVAVKAGIAAEDLHNVYWYSYGDIDADQLALKLEDASQFRYVLTGDISLPEDVVFELDLYGIQTVMTDHHASAIRTWCSRPAWKIPPNWSQDIKSLYISAGEKDPNYSTSAEVFFINRTECVNEAHLGPNHWCFFPKNGEKISGALVLWLAINGDGTGKGIPEALELTSAWDAWDLESSWRENGTYFNACLLSRNDRLSLAYGKDEGRRRNVIDNLVPMLGPNENALILDALYEGGVLQTHNEGQWARTARNAYTIQWEGCRLLCLNARGSSLVTKSVYDPEQHEGVVMWAINKEGKVSVSLYNENVTDSSPDMSAIAKKYGGGGHKGAAGCVMSKIPPEFLIPVE